MRSTRFLLSSAVVSVAMAFAAACSGGAKKADEPPAAQKPKEPTPGVVSVETKPIEIKKMPRYMTLTGTILADRQSEVAANVSGRIISSAVERGQPVKQGQVIAVVDSRSAGFSASAATAQSKVAEAQLKQAESDCDRADKLLQQGAISRVEHEKLKTACSSQVFSATAARANADLAQKQLGDTTIRAPFDGVIGERYINVGEYVQPQTKVASVYRINPVRVQISVPESATPLIKAGDSLNVRVAAWGDRDFPATIKYVAPALRQATRDLLVEAIAENSDGALRPGMFASVHLLVGEADEPTVPQNALKIDGATKRLFLAKNGQAWEMVVKTGASREGRVAVQEALTIQDRVIIQPPPGLRDGAAVSYVQ